MRRTRLILPLPLILLVLVACGSPKTAPQAVPQVASKNGEPAWVMNSNEDGLEAVGIANPNPLNDQMYQRKLAIAQARNQLAGNQEVAMSAALGQVTKEVLGTPGGKNAKVADAIEQVTRDTIRQVVSQKLAGAIPIRFYKAPDGTLFVLVSMRHAMVQSAHKAIKTVMANGDAELDAALDKMDEAIAKTDTTDTNGN